MTRGSATCMRLRCTMQATAKRRCASSSRCSSAIPTTATRSPRSSASCAKPATLAALRTSLRDSMPSSHADVETSRLAHALVVRVLVRYPQLRSSFVNASHGYLLLVPFPGYVFAHVVLDDPAR